MNIRTYVRKFLPPATLVLVICGAIYWYWRMHEASPPSAIDRTSSHNNHPANQTSFTESSPPTIQDIKKWWAKDNKESIELDGKLSPIHLRDKTLAFIASASFYERGRNFISNSILIRPDIGEVRTTDLGSIESVHDLNHDGISEVVVVGVGSGQGTTSYTNTLAQFDGWTPIELHTAEYGDNLGACGDPDDGLNECESIDIQWNFKDLNGDGIDDLEEIQTTTHDDDKNVVTNRYLFSGTRLSKQSSSKESSQQAR